VALPEQPRFHRKRRATLLLAGLTLLVLVLSIPSSLRYLRENHGLYLFSRAFVEDIPRRLSGPGRFRFVLQPLVAIVLGVRGGLADARAGRPPYLWGVLFRRDVRGEFVRSGLATLVNMLLVGVLVDSICQWLILGASYLGAALVVGPVLIVAPYAVARALANRAASSRR
jgi:hypothetical protein